MAIDRVGAVSVADVQVAKAIQLGVPIEKNRRTLKRIDQ